jgi:putative ABC transport system substrate-binding protein
VSASALQQATRTVPIVFANTMDPVGAGLVANLARPGGNLTGFATFEYGFSGKWLELLKQIAPRVTRVGVLRDPTFASGIGQLAGIQAVAPSFGVELSPIDMRDGGESSAPSRNSHAVPITDLSCQRVRASQRVIAT